jgi:hypothetical protein
MMHCGIVCQSSLAAILFHLSFASIALKCDKLIQLYLAKVLLATTLCSAKNTPHDDFGHITNQCIVAYLSEENSLVDPKLVACLEKREKIALRDQAE